MQQECFLPKEPVPYADKFRVPRRYQNRDYNITIIFSGHSGDPKNISGLGPIMGTIKVMITIGGWGGGGRLMVEVDMKNPTISCTGIYVFSK